MTDWADWIGREQVRHDMLTPALLARFRATFDSDDTGDVAPQGIHWCLCTPDTASAALDTDGHPRRGDFLPPVPLPRRMWASSKLVFAAPIMVGAKIERRSVIAGIEEKTGGSGPLMFVEVDHVTTSNGVVAVTERQTIVYRGASSSGAAPSRQGDDPPSGYPWQRMLTPVERLLFRYSALTFNSHRIHYDAPYATDQEDYKGVVVQGPLTATLLLDLAAHHVGANRLSSFDFRCVSAAIAGESLQLAGRQVGLAIALAAIGPDERIVMTATAHVTG